MSETTGSAWRGIINEQTVFPLSIVLALASFAFWLATVAANTASNTKDIMALAAETKDRFEYNRDQRQQGDKTLSERMRETDKVIREQAERLGRIEGKIDLIAKAVEKRY